MDLLNQYLQNTVGNATSNITDVMFQWLVIPSIVFMAIIIALYIWRTIRRRKVDSAILEIRDMLREMRAIDTLPVQPAPPQDDTPTK